jgi:hypothetical protein
VISRTINRTECHVGKRKRKLTAAEKAAKRKRKAEFQTVFLNGKMKRIRRPPQIDGMDADEWIRQNADDIFLHEEGMWDVLEERHRLEEGDDYTSGGDHTSGDGTRSPAEEGHWRTVSPAEDLRHNREGELDDLELPF